MQTKTWNYRFVLKSLELYVAENLLLPRKNKRHVITVLATNVSCQRSAITQVRYDSQITNLQIKVLLLAIFHIFLVLKFRLLDGQS